MDERDSSVRVRFAPSPTGPIHVGALHTALFNWLFARHHGGRFILRFEDTDRARSEERWEDVIYKEMRWLGMDWDEGPDIGGSHGPYRQMERLDLYREYAERLVASGHAYRCYCTPEEIDAERKKAQAEGRPPLYSRRCRHLSAEEQAQFAAEGRPSVIRFAVPDDKIVRFDDLVRGPIETPTDSLSDFVMVRTSGIPLYNFAVVVDDLTMQITHVLRGESHIPNTVPQLLLYEALGVTPPRIGHLGDLLGANRKKLSKRDGDAYVGDYRDKGYLPEALLNFMALMGWSPPGDDEVTDREQMIAAFRLERLSKAPSTFDLTKLEWLNGHYIRKMSPAKLSEVCLPFLQQAGLIGQEPTSDERDKLAKIVALEQERIKTLEEIVPGATFVFTNELTYDEASVKKVLKPETQNYLREVADALSEVATWEHEQIEAAIRALAEAKGLGARKAFQPIRVAVTGSMVSPPLFESLEILGRTRALERIRYAAEHLY